MQRSISSLRDTSRRFSIVVEIGWFMGTGS
jgi:hypothetical protein